MSVDEGAANNMITNKCVACEATELSFFQTALLMRSKTQIQALPAAEIKPVTFW